MSSCKSMIISKYKREREVGEGGRENEQVGKIEGGGAEGGTKMRMEIKRWDRINHQNFPA